METVDLRQFMPLLAPVIAAVATQAVKWALPRIPKVLLPLLSTALGAVTAAVGFQVGPENALALGLAGTGVAEGGKQLGRVVTQHPARLRVALLVSLLPLGWGCSALTRVIPFAGGSPEHRVAWRGQASWAGGVTATMVEMDSGDVIATCGYCPK